MIWAKSFSDHSTYVRCKCFNFSIEFLAGKEIDDLDALGR